MARKAEEIRRRALFEIATLAEPFIPVSLFGTLADEKKDIYTRQRTFWEVLWQTLHPDVSRRAAVRKLRSLWHGERRWRPSPATGAYCIAWQRLEVRDWGAKLETSRMGFSQCRSRFASELDPSIFKS